jgi:broad specificity phosphatase PhoE
MKHLYLVRHGETAWTISGQHTGLTDLPLTEQGSSQAKMLRDVLSSKSFEKVLASPLKRAMQTCQLAGYQSQAQIDPDLVEWNYGNYEGKTHVEIIKENPGWTIFSQGAPGGESVAQIGARADRVLHKISSCTEDVLIFSHGHFLRTLAARWLKLPPSEGKLFLLSTASISILGYEKLLPVVLKWNDTHHLD